MKSGKTKIRDSVANIGNLKEQLNCVLKEMHAYTTKIEDVKAHSKDEDFGYKRFADLDTRLTSLTNKYKPGKESSRATMFLIKTIIETLAEGPMTEKDIKSKVLDRCRDLGIKSTNRGTIAGLNMDVGVACNILAHLGAIELHTQGTSTPERQKEVAAQILSVLDQRWDTHLTKYLAECKKESQAAAEAALAAAAAAQANASTSAEAQSSAVGSSDAMAGGVTSTPSAVGTAAVAGGTASSASGGSLDRRLLSPLMPSPEQNLFAPSQDLGDLSFGLDSPLAIAGTPAAAAGSTGGLKSSAPNSLAGSSGGSKMQMSSSERIAQCFDHSLSNDNLEALVNLDQSALNDSELMDSLMVMGSSPLPEDCGDFDDVSPDDFPLPPDDASVAVSTNDQSSVNHNHSTVGSSSKQGGSSGGGQGGVSSGTSATGATGSSSGGHNSRSQKAVSGRRSTATQKLWRIKTDHSATSIEGLLRPEESLKQWSSASFKEAVSLEIEEHLLRRIAGQCDFHLKPTPFRSGTRYLDPIIGASLDEQDGGLSASALCSSPGGSLGGSVAAGMLSHASTVSLNGSQFNNQNSAGATSAGVPALYDDHVNITGAYLLDKVKRSKRQRGSCLYSGSSSVPQFNINYIHTLSNICNSTTSHYWNNTMKYASTVGGSGGHHHHHHSALSSSASMTSLSSFVQSSANNGSLKKAGSISGKSGASSAVSDAGAPYNLYPKHYSQPTYISSDWLTMPLKPAASSAGGKVPLYSTAVHMPDLSTYTTEEPWSTVSKEFVVLSGEDAGAVFWEHSAASGAGTGSGAIHRNTSSAAVHSAASGASSAEASGPVNKKQKLTKSGDSSGNLKNAGAAAHAKKNLLPAYDVAAPQFREVIPPPHNKSAVTVNNYRSHLTSSSSNGSINGSTGIGGGVFYPSPNKVEGISHKNLSPAALAATPSAIAASATASSLATISEDGSDAEEDLSDEALLARHDAVLRNMREKWALMQQLKLETRRGGPVSELTGGGYRKMTSSSSVAVAMDGSAVEGSVTYAGSGTHMKYRKYAAGSAGGAAGAAAVEGGIAATKKSPGGRGAASFVVGVANGLNTNNSMMKRRGRPPKFVKSVHGGAGTSQRGNNQYTAIRAAAAAAAALSLQLQQQGAVDGTSAGAEGGDSGAGGEFDDVTAGAVGLDEESMEVTEDCPEEE